MRSIFFVLVYLTLSGCVTSFPVATAPVESGTEKVTHDVMPELPYGPPLAASANDPDCTQAYILAERSILSGLKSNANEVEIDNALFVDHRLVGVWFSDSDWCAVYDLTGIKKTNQFYSPHEQFMEDLEGADWTKGLLIETAVNADDFMFAKVFDCPLCL